MWKKEEKKLPPLLSLPLLFPYLLTTYRSCLLSSVHRNSTALRWGHWGQRKKRPGEFKNALQLRTQWQQSSAWIGVGFFLIPVSARFQGWQDKG